MLFLLDFINLWIKALLFLNNIFFHWLFLFWVLSRYSWTIPTYFWNIALHYCFIPNSLNWNIPGRGNILEHSFRNIHITGTYNSLEHIIHWNIHWNNHWNIHWNIHWNNHWNIHWIIHWNIHWNITGSFTGSFTGTFTGTSLDHSLDHSLEHSLEHSGTSPSITVSFPIPLTGIFQGGEKPFSTE